MNYQNHSFLNNSLHFVSHFTEICGNTWQYNAIMRIFVRDENYVRLCGIVRRIIVTFLFCRITKQLPLFQLNLTTFPFLHRRDHFVFRLKFLKCLMYSPFVESQLKIEFCKLFLHYYRAALLPITGKCLYTQVFDLCESVQICRISTDLCRYVHICRISADLCRYVHICRISAYFCRYVQIRKKRTYSET